MSPLRAGRARGSLPTRRRLDATGMLSGLLEGTRVDAYDVAISRGVMVGRGRADAG